MRERIHDNVEPGGMRAADINNNTVDSMDWSDLLQTSSHMETEAETAVEARDGETVRIITADRREVILRRTALEDCSMFFRTLLTGPYAEAETQIIHLTTVTAEALQQCMSMCEALSRGDSQVAEDITLRTACKALDTAAFLGLDELIEQLSHAVLANVDHSKIIEIYRFISLRNVDLANRLWGMIATKFQTMYDTDEYKQLSLDEMQKLMLEPRLNLRTRDEEAVVDGWTRAQTPADAAQFRDFAYRNMHMKAEDRSTHFVFKQRIPSEILMSLGGWSPTGPTNIIETYSARTNTWTASPVHLFEQQRAYHGMVVMEDKLFVLGGFNGTDYFPHTKVFDFKTLKWSERGAMHQHRCYVATCAMTKTHLIAGGGFDGGTRMSSAEVYDICKNQWIQITDMGNARSDGAMVPLADRVYALGGFDGHEIHDSVEYYDPGNDQWYAFRPMTSRRTGISALALQENVIAAVGGFNGTSRLKTFEFCDIREPKWHRVSEMSVTRSNFAACVFGNKIIACGGFDGARTTNKCEEYDLRMNRWYEFPSMHLSKSALRIAHLTDPDVIQALINYKHDTDS